MFEHIARFDIDGVNLHGSRSRKGPGFGRFPTSLALKGEAVWRPKQRDGGGRTGARRGKLAARGRILNAVRGFFAEEGFIEVETPALQVSPGLEPHLRAFATVV